QLTISQPVSNKKGAVMKLMDKDEASDVLASFKGPTIKWHDHPNARHKAYSRLVDSNDRKDIANVVHTLMRKKMEVEQNNKKLGKRDENLLNTAQERLFEELALSLDTS